MSKSTVKRMFHTCPRNCPSSCSIISSIENNNLVHITGDQNDHYTKGKLCAKGFSYVEKNNHPDRLKYPYFQETKGSGQLQQITWEKAFEIILNKIINIDKSYNSFLPIGLWKGTGNIGVHHFVTEHFFTSIGPTTKIGRAAKPASKFSTAKYDTGSIKMSNPKTITKANIIICWGSNPAATNIHLIPHIIEAKMGGAKIVVIDPLYTKTAELADLFIQICPSTDGVLANLLVKKLLNEGAVDYQFIKEHSTGFSEFESAINKLDESNSLKKCDIEQEPIAILLDWLKNKQTVAHIVGTGLTKHTNGGQSVRAIQALAAIRGDLGKLGGGVFFNGLSEPLFNNEHLVAANSKNRIIHLHDLAQDNFLQNQLPIEMLWISGANPLVQAPNIKLIEQFINDIPFVVTVEQFLTPTAKMSNLILPTTTHFEEMDIIVNDWRNKISFNDQAIPPFYQSKSEWKIMNELAIRLKKSHEDMCSFPIYRSEEEYLNAQFNEEVSKRFFVKNMSELRERINNVITNTISWEDHVFLTESGKYQFYSEEATVDGLSPIPIYKDGNSPTLDYPLWLITPHHPYAFNSQFHFLNLSNKNEAYVEINAKLANKLGVFEGEIIKVFNDLGSIEIKAHLNPLIPKDIVMVYNGTYTNSKVNINELVPITQTDKELVSNWNDGVAFYDTFVNIAKLQRV